MHFRPVPNGPITAMDALEALLAEPEYRHHYCSPENDSAGGPLHGPYWADRIKISDFTEMPADESESSWKVHSVQCGRYVPIPADLGASQITCELGIPGWCLGGRGR